MKEIQQSRTTTIVKGHHCQNSEDTIVEPPESNHKPTTTAWRNEMQVEPNPNREM
jgi:hypothetical protein